MAFVSYAQNFEDVMLWRALGHVERGFYIDVGAQSPDLDSVTRAFSDAGWRGINVEPHPAYFADLLNRRPHDVNLQCALGERPGSATISLVGATGLSTLDPSIAGRYLDDGYLIERIEVSVETLNSVWTKHVPLGQPVHFLKVDVEGFELQVLRGNDWAQHRPWVVVVEATRPNSQEESFSEWEPNLTGAQYTFVYADGLNRYYVAEEEAQLKDAFRYPPNVFDHFIVAPLESTRRELEQADSMLGSTRQELAQAELRLESTRGHLAQAESLLASMSARTAQLESSLQTSQRKGAQRQVQLEQMTDRCNELFQDVSNRDKKLQDLAHRWNETLEALGQVSCRLDETHLRAVSSEADLAIARKQAAALRSEISGLYGSRSWRVTAVARFLAHKLRHLLRSRAP